MTGWPFVSKRRKVYWPGNIFLSSKVASLVTGLGETDIDVVSPVTGLMASMMPLSLKVHLVLASQG